MINLNIFKFIIFKFSLRGMSRGRKNIGDWGEKQAVLFLKRHGFIIIEMNYHTTVGEIDIVAKKDDDIYFIEVKTRTNEWLANDLSITPAKIRKFKKTVNHYCYKRGVEGLGIVLAGLIIFLKKEEEKACFRLFVMNF